jgi:hypothetical protein
MTQNEPIEQTDGEQTTEIEQPAKGESTDLTGEGNLTASDPGDETPVEGE